MEDEKAATKPENIKKESKLAKNKREKYSLFDGCCIHCF